MNGPNRPVIGSAVGLVYEILLIENVCVFHRNEV